MHHYPCYFFTRIILFCFAQNKVEMRNSVNIALVAGFCVMVSCTKDISAHRQLPQDMVKFTDVVDVLSCAGLGMEQVVEVHDAVSASLGNGYDEEYTLHNMFETPGSGVGDNLLHPSAKAGTKAYSKPLRDLFYSYYTKATKGGDEFTAQDYINYIKSSDIQIYWPFSGRWDGRTLPVITFDPLDGSDSNKGWYMDADGQLQEITVTEETAMQRPVWVINNNDDSRHMTVDVMRKNNPDWAQGGNVVIGGSKAVEASKAAAATPAPIKSLVLKDFTMNRNYDNWFQGGSEFFVKIGSIESFTAKNESDIYLYNPSITDFIVVVRRSQMGEAVELNTLLVSEWTSQLNSCAFMIIEDDGGEIQSWNCSATVKYNSKSYGFDISIPYRSRDDIVWRGQLSRRYIEATDKVSGNFGDVKLTFSINTLTE